MMKMIVVMMLLLVLSSSIVVAHSEHDEHTGFEQAEALINARISCDRLTQDQLVLIGDYYMEQLHPGEEHERMDAMMDTVSLREMHIGMAESFYCDGSSVPSRFGMMGGYSGGFHHRPWFGWTLALVVAGLVFGAVLLWTSKR